MEGNMTIDLGTLLGLLIIAGIILAIYAIVAVNNLIKTLKKAQTVLDDFEVVAKVASKRTKELDKFIDDTAKKVKAGQNIFNSLPIIFSAIGKIAKVVGQQNKKPE
jgi:H+/gluconate symporter-like permease